MSSLSLAEPEIQAQLMAEVLLCPSVGFLVWDENRRYVAANHAACEILGATLEELFGHEVGDHTVEGLDAIEGALSSGFAQGRAVVDRFDGGGRVDVFYATFVTKTAGMPYMSTVIAPIR